MFLDEAGINIRMAREYGYSKKGKRVFDFRSGQYARNYTVLGAMSHKGMGALMTVNGGTTKPVFIRYVKDVLLPTLKAGQVVVLDNLAAHKSQEVRKLFWDAGIEVIYTPPYSPEWNPIEWSWSKIKNFLRGYAARSLEALNSALVKAADLITPDDAYNWIQACGFMS